MAISTIVSGKPLTIMAVCIAPKPPEAIKTTADKANIIPHVIFTKFFGFRLPNDVCIPNTNVAESADVMKKVDISMSVTIINILVSGSCSYMKNNAVSRL